jgi:SAM-dependent methyltransferase
LLYSDDLACIHIEGYGFHWAGMAPGVLEWLREAGLKRGKVVDLGCGGGDWLARLASAGFTPCGIDISPAMIRAARRRVRGAELWCGSFAELPLPKCAAVTALGEPLNYLSDRTEFRRVLRNVYRALEPGGVFIFDVRLPATRPVEPRIVARTGDDWACIAAIEENPATRRLVRRITTFRRVGKLFRRSEEHHTLQLYDKRMIRDWLKRLGFRVRGFNRCGDYRLGRRQVIFVAEKGRGAPSPTTGRSAE